MSRAHSGPGRSTLQPAWLLHGGAGQRRHVGDRTRRRDARGRASSDQRRASSGRYGSRRRRGVGYGMSRRTRCPLPTRVGRACYEAYNHWLIDFCAAKPERLIGVAQLSLEDPEAARGELERLALRGGLRHVNILAARANPPVYDDAWEPFWTLAEEVCYPDRVSSRCPGQKDASRCRRSSGANPAIAIASRFPKSRGAFSCSNPSPGLFPPAFFDRHPGVKIVMAEAGLAWIPSMIQVSTSGMSAAATVAGSPATVDRAS